MRTKANAEAKLAAAQEMVCGHIRTGFSEGTKAGYVLAARIIGVMARDVHDSPKQLALLDSIQAALASAPVLNRGDWMEQITQYCAELRDRRAGK